MIAPTAVLELDKGRSKSNLIGTGTDNSTSAGVVDEFRKVANGFNPTSVCWRDINMNLLGVIGFNPDKTVSKHDMVCIPQQQLCT